jgi:ubiquinone biosynthesis protein
MGTLFSSLIPKRWQRSRQIVRILVRHGFGFLLESAGLRLVWFRQRRKQRSTLPPAHRLRLALEELGPTFIKLGQVLSTRPDLVPPAFVVELAQLQDRVPPFPFEQVQSLVEQELGASLEELFLHFDEQPLAAASLSQVHAAMLPTGEEVVVKVQRPGLTDTIAMDLEILRNLARLAEQRIPLMELYDLVGIVEEFAHTLRGELDFRREGHNADRFRRNFAGASFLHIPWIHWDYTTHRVLTLERIRGIKIDDLVTLDAAGLDRHRIALHATRIVMQGVFEDGFFHADPHPGNFFVLEKEVIAAMDFGMVGRISTSLRQELVRLFVVAVRMDTEEIVEQLLRMSLVERDVDQAGLRRDLDRMLQQYVGRSLQEVIAREIVEEAMAIAFRRRLRMPAELWLLGKMIAMLEGVGLHLDPDFDPFAVARPYAERFMRESLSPEALLLEAWTGLEDWADLVAEIPVTMPALVTQLQNGELSLGMELRQIETSLSALNTLSVQLALGILIATLSVVVVIFLQPFLSPKVWWGWTLLGIGIFVLLIVLFGLLWTSRPGE